MNQVSESSGRWAGPRRGLLGTVATLGMVAGSLAVAQPASAAPITALTASSTPTATGRALTVTWTTTPSGVGEPSDVLGYVVQADGPDGGTLADGTGCTIDAALLPNSCEITGLLAGTAYTVTVKATDDNLGVGAVLKTATITPGATTTPKLPQPDAPAAVATGVSGEVEVTAGANPVAAADVDHFTATAYLGGVATARTCTTEDDDRACTITGLTNGTDYTFKTVAHAPTANGVSVASAASGLVAPAIGPEAPTDVTAEVVSATGVDVSWTASPTEDVVYVVKPYIAASGVAVADADAVGCEVGTPTAETTCSVTGLTTNVGYYFKVYAVLDGFHSADTTKTSTVYPTAPPDNPENATAVAGDASATVTWEDPSDLTIPVASYKVTARIDGDETEQTCTTEDAEDLSCKVEGLTNDTEYTFAVQSVGISGAVSVDEVSNAVTPEEAPKPEAPTGLELTATGTTIEVTWDEPAAGGDVAVVHYVATAMPGNKSCATASDEVYTCTITGLEPATEYTVTLVARGADNSSEGAEDTVTTLAGGGPGGPGAGEPTGPVVVNPDGKEQIFTRGTGVQALWTAVKNAQTGAWENWTSLGGPLYSDPVPVRNADGKLQVFVLDVSGFVTYKLQGADGMFGDWKRISMDRSIAKIVAAKNANGSVQIFGRSGDHLWTAYQTTGADAWSNWVDLGYPVSGDPTVVAMADGALELFTAGHMGAVYRRAQTAPNANTWTGWVKVAPSAAASEFV